MQVLRLSTLRQHGTIPRSDVAMEQELLELWPSPAGAPVAASGSYVPANVCVFISHHWWQRCAPDEVTGYDASTPDYTHGPSQNLKYRTLCSGLDALVERERLDPARVAVWMDWFSISQEDPTRKAQCIRSMLHYVKQCDYVLIPLPTETVSTETGVEANYPEEIETYGTRSWCR